MIENGADLSAPILVMSARDRDDPPYNRIEYSLRDDLGGTFRINATTGEIFAERQLDRETDAEYMLEVHLAIIAHYILRNLFAKTTDLIPNRCQRQTLARRGSAPPVLLS